MSSNEQQPSRRVKGIRLSVAERYYERGLYHFTKGKLDLALADLDEAVDHAPRDAELYTARGLILLQSGWPDDAEADFAYALRLDPTQWLAHYGRGMHAFQNEDYQTAIDHFSRAQFIAKDRAEIYYHRAVAFYEMDNIPQAVLDMQAAQELFENNKKRQSQADKWLKILEQAQSG